MATSVITINTPVDTSRKVRVEIDADQFERLSATLGLFNPEFLGSLDRAEKDYRAGRYRKVKSLKELRNK